MRLEGKAALVTGSSQGIGRAIALRLAQEGADVVVHYNSSPEEAKEVCGEIRALGRQSVFLGANTGSVKEVRQLVSDSVAKLGRLDILVNNAGMEKKAAFWDVTEEDYDTVLNVNLRGVFFGTQAFVQYLRKEKRPGKVIHMSSVHEDLPFPHFAAYCASKGGIRMLTRTLAVELKGLGITVNGIAPGAIKTPINAKLMEEPEKLRALLAKIPLGRLGTPEDVAGLAAFLASPDADYVTGSTFFVDGGLTYNYEEQ